MLKEGDELIPCPCGKCLPCLKRRVSAWSFRLMQEDKRSDSALFVTLTYDTNHVPITPRGFMTLRKSDVQKFMKRLRKRHTGKPLKYYYAGEYGGKTMRPHYHMILFNAEHKDVEASWQLGQVHYGTVSEASVGYTLKYIVKPGKIPLHKNDDRQPEYSNMSKRLGDNYLTPKIIKWHKNDLVSRTYVPLPGGQKAPMARYYKDKIYSKREKADIADYHQGKGAANPVLRQTDEYRLALLNEMKQKVKNLAACRKN